MPDDVKEDEKPTDETPTPTQTTQTQQTTEEVKPAAEPVAVQVEQQKEPTFANWTQDEKDQLNDTIKKLNERLTPKEETGTARAGEEKSVKDEQIDEPEPKPERTRKHKLKFKSRSARK